VPHIEKRIAEARKLGFKLFIGPKWTGGGKPLAGHVGVNTARQALNVFLEKN
jgi:predicted ATP-dependent serine protease